MGCRNKDEFKISFFEYIKFTIEDFVKAWIYPAYSVRHLLFNRYDLVKLTKFKPIDYVEVNDRIFEANMELLKYFVESDPEKHVLWYKDEKDEDVGPKYGLDPQYTVLYPELKNEWIMDLIKETYDWYMNKYQVLLDDASYILGIWNDIYYEYWFTPCTDNSEMEEYHAETKVYTIDELNKFDIDWNRILKYAPRKIKEDFLDGNNIKKLHDEISGKINLEKQYYLHLIIELRPYLWT